MALLVQQKNVARERKPPKPRKPMSSGTVIITRLSGSWLSESKLFLVRLASDFISDRRLLVLEKAGWMTEKLSSKPKSEIIFT